MSGHLANNIADNDDFDRKESSLLVLPTHETNHDSHRTMTDASRTPGGSQDRFLAAGNNQDSRTFGAPEGYERDTTSHTVGAAGAPTFHPLTTYESADLPARPPISSFGALAYHLSKEVDPKGCVTPMVFACFMTGFTSAASFTACFIWCGFQTGNAAQLGLALARTFQPNAERGFLMPDKQAFTSLCSFILGTSFGRIGDRVGSSRRSWLVGATILQSLGLVVACLMLHFGRQSDYATDRGQPSWTNGWGFAALAFLSATLGLQGIIGKRLNTQFATAVVLTTIWVELVNDPMLFTLKHVRTRDHKFAGVIALFLGAFVSRALIDAIGTVGTLGIGAGLRFLGAGMWLFVAGKQA